MPTTTTKAQREKYLKQLSQQIYNLLKLIKDHRERPDIDKERGKYFVKDRIELDRLLSEPIGKPRFSYSRKLLSGDPLANFLHTKKSNKDIDDAEDCLSALLRRVQGERAENPSYKVAIGTSGSTDKYLRRRLGAPVPGSESQEQLLISKVSAVDEKGIGYFKFNKRSKRIKIGGAKTRIFRLLKCLCDPPGAMKNIETIYEAIKLPKDDTGWMPSEGPERVSQMLNVITNTKKELQKIKELQGRVRYASDPQKRTIRLEIG